MRTAFADAFYFFALLSKRDAAHAKVVAWTKAFAGRITTTERVLTELADGLANSKKWGVFNTLREKILPD